MNACTRLDSVVGASNFKSYNCDTLPNQVPVRKMEHKSTAEINSLLLDSGYWGRRNKTNIVCLRNVFFLFLFLERIVFNFSPSSSLQKLSPTLTPNLTSTPTPASRSRHPGHR